MNILSIYKLLRIYDMKNVTRQNCLKKNVISVLNQKEGYFCYLKQFCFAAHSNNNLNNYYNKKSSSRVKFKVLRLKYFVIALS